MSVGETGRSGPITEIQLLNCTCRSCRSGSCPPGRASRSLRPAAPYRAPRTHPSIAGRTRRDARAGFVALDRARRARLHALFAPPHHTARRAVIRRLLGGARRDARAGFVALDRARRARLHAVFAPPHHTARRALSVDCWAALGETHVPVLSLWIMPAGQGFTQSSPRRTIPRAAHSSVDCWAALGETHVPVLSLWIMPAGQGFTQSSPRRTIPRAAQLSVDCSGSTRRDALAGHIQHLATRTCRGGWTKARRSEDRDCEGSEKVHRSSPMSARRALDEVWANPINAVTQVTARGPISSIELQSVSTAVQTILAHLRRTPSLSMAISCGRFLYWRRSRCANRPAQALFSSGSLCPSQFARRGEANSSLPCTFGASRRPLLGCLLLSDCDAAPRPVV